MVWPKGTEIGGVLSLDVPRLCLKHCPFCLLYINTYWISHYQEYVMFSAHTNVTLAF